ncbi:MAG TPA: M28 family peptidase [Gaiellaceae bacterium]|nr:M28 family peptidase [Gaiellaceae bacterium]
MVVVAVPLLAAAFTISRPAPLPQATAGLEPTFDPAAAYRLAQELAGLHPDRSPGSPASGPAARWVAGKLRALGLRTRVDRFSASVAGRGRVDLRNVGAVVPGRSRDTILVVAHRDSTRGHPGTNDNASGTAALLELARAFSGTRAAVAGGGPSHTLSFVSTDAGAYGLLGARRLARAPQAEHVVAVVVLDAIGSRDDPRLEIAGRGPRSPAPGLVATAEARLKEETGEKPGTAGALGQLIDLGFPLSLTEQFPFLAEGVPALTVTTEGSRADEDERPGRLDPVTLGRVGRAAEGLVASLDASLEPARGTNAYLYVGGRVIEGWAVALLYVALLVPFVLCLADLVARLRRWRVALRPALRSYLRRLAFWLFVGAMFLLFAALGAWPRGDEAAISPASEAASHWPRLGLVVFALVLAAAWLVARGRLVAETPAEPEEELAGMAVALSALAVITLVLIVTNPHALLFVLPSAHAWLWLTQLRSRRGLVRAALYVAGLAGPLLVVGSTALRFGLGLDAPWYLAELTALGYVSVFTLILVLAWLAVAAQVLAVTTGRYAPYPSPAERPARGTVGNAIAALRSSWQRS